MPSLRKLLALLSAVLLLVLTLLGLSHYRQQEYAKGYKASVITAPTFAQRWAPDMQVTDHTGQLRQLADFKGKVVLLFFGYTQCPDVCPTALFRAKQVMEQLGNQAEQVQILFMTLDPQRDTVSLLAEYVPYFDRRFIGLRPSPESIPQLSKEFKVFYRVNPGAHPDTYTLDHGVTSYAYNRQGELRLAISHTASAEEVTADIQRLLGE